MWSLPAEWEEALWGAAQEELPAGALDPRSLAAAIGARSDRYTRERSSLAAPLAPRDRPRDLAARALFFTVADAAKVAVPLAELAGRGLVPDHEPLRILDAGAGCGAMTIGAAAALPGRALEVVAVDRDAAALALFTRAVALRADARIRLHVVAGELAACPPGPFDLILAGTVLNELPAPARLPAVRALLGRLAAGGAAIILEPALRETARALHEVRDALIQAGDAHVFAPCTRHGAPCPALADERDWCHEDRPFAPPPRLARLIRQTGLRREGLKFAYLTLRREPADLVEGTPGRRALRVVSGPLDQKGTTERIVCGDEGRTHLRVLKRDRSDENRELGEARRGDVLLVDDAGGITRIRPA
jgi:ribosomal protein RSM22 (predicted rRNA methylase)